jgi:hypothetical protein
MNDSKLKFTSAKLKAEITKRPTFTILTDDKIENPTVLKKPPTKELNFTLPKNFDGKEVWKEYIGEVLDQGSCGSCWAYASTGILQSRFAIQSLGQINIPLSPERLVICAGDDTTINWDLENLAEYQINSTEIIKNYGCSGNTLLNAFIYLFIIGTVSSYCINDSFGDNGKFMKLSTVTEGDSRSLPLCGDVGGIYKDLCQNNWINRITGVESGSAARFFSCILFYALPNDEREIMIELFRWGPVATALSLHADFYTYDFSKIYVWDRTSVQVAGHAVQIVGWGVENGKKFWWVKNSWGKDWGINGYFKILRGENMCNIEINCYGAQPNFFYTKLDQFFKYNKFEYEITNKKYWEQILSLAYSALDILKDSGFGGGDSISGFSRRILDTRPWIDSSRIIDLETLPDFNTFIAGKISSSAGILENTKVGDSIEKIIENYTKPVKRYPYAYIIMIVILFSIFIILFTICLVTY